MAEPSGYEKTELSGQAVLPGFQEILECEAAALKKPEHEAFCAAYATNGGDSARAWQTAIDSACARLQAQKNSHRLLKNEEIRRRIAEISAVMRNRTINEVVASSRNALHFDPADYFDQETGAAVPIHKIPEAKRQGIGLEARIVDGCLRYVPVFPSPEKARDSLAKIMGVEKQLLELSGKNGGPVEMSVPGLMKALAETRDLVGK